jgi:hypothetical protein
MGRLRAARWTAAIGTAAVIMTSNVLLAQVGTGRRPGEPPSATEKYWTEERKREAVPLMPSPAVDPKAPRSRNPKPAGPVRPMTQPASPQPAAESR